MTRSPLPDELRGSALRTTTAPRHGTTASRLRRSDVDHPFHGVSAIDLDLDEVRDRCRAFQPVMEPGQAFTHTTALSLWQAPLPRLGPELHVGVLFPRTPPRRDGIHGHSLRRLPTVPLGPWSVAPPVEAWVQSASLLGRGDLTAVGDHLLGRGIAPEILTDAVAEARGRPGSGRLAWAGMRIRPGVRSRPETHVRLLIVGARLPEPAVAPAVVVASGLVVHPDLAYVERRLALEYEGDGHRDAGQWEADIERRELLAEAGWRTIRVTRSQLYRAPQQLIARIRRHLAS